MPRRLSIWILLAILIVATTATSGVIWNTQQRSNYVAARGLIDAKSSIDSDLQRLKSAKDRLNFEDSFDSAGLRIRTYYDSSNRIVIVEYFDQSGHITKSTYDTNGAGVAEVTEYFGSNGTVARTEYDVNGDSVVEIIVPNNKGGVIQTSDVELRFGDKFMPFSSFGNLVM